MNPDNKRRDRDTHMVIYYLEPYVVSSFFDKYLISVSCCIHKIFATRVYFQQDEYLWWKSYVTNMFVYIYFSRSIQSKPKSPDQRKGVNSLRNPKAFFWVFFLRLLTIEVQVNDIHINGSQSGLTLNFNFHYNGKIRSHGIWLDNLKSYLTRVILNCERIFDERSYLILAFGTVILGDLVNNRTENNNIIWKFFNGNITKIKHVESFR